MRLRCGPTRPWIDQVDRSEGPRTHGDSPASTRRPPVAEIEKELMGGEPRRMCAESEDCSSKQNNTHQPPCYTPKAPATNAARAAGD